MAPGCQLLGGARAGGRRRPSRKRLTPARGHSLTPRRWQRKILSGFLFLFFVVFSFLFVFLGFFCFLKEKYSEDTRKRKKIKMRKREEDIRRKGSAKHLLECNKSNQPFLLHSCRPSELPSPATVISSTRGTH